LDDKTFGEKWNMSRIALVTGGTRGIGAAISIALKKTATQSPPTTPAMTSEQPHLKLKPDFSL